MRSHFLHSFCRKKKKKRVYTAAPLTDKVDRKQYMGIFMCSFSRIITAPRPFAPRTVPTRDCSLPDHLPLDCSYPYLSACGPFAPLMFLPVTVHFRTICNRTVPTRDVLLPDHLLWITCPRPGLFMLWTIKRSPFCACAVHNVDHLPPDSSYSRPVAPGLFRLWIINFVPGLFIL